MYDSFQKDYYRFVRKRRRSNCACYLIIISQFWPGVKSDSSPTLFKNNTYNLIRKFNQQNQFVCLSILHVMVMPVKLSNVSVSYAFAM